MHEFQTPDPIAARLSLVSAKIELNATDTPTTTVDVQPSDPDDPNDVKLAERTQVTFDGHVLEIKGPRSLRSFRAQGSIEVTVQLPAGSDLKAELATGELRGSGALGDCRVETAAGGVELERTRTVKLSGAVGGVAVGEVDGDARIEQASGEIRVGRIGGDARIDNAGGEINVGSIAGKAKLSGANGDIVAQRCEDSVTAQTAFGTIRLRSVSQGMIKADSARGDIEVGIAPGTAAWLALNTAFGHAHSELDQAIAPRPGEPTVEVHASTAFGDVTIRRAPAADDTELAASEA